MRVSLLVFVAEDLYSFGKESVIEKEKDWENWAGWVCLFIRVSERQRKK